MNGLTVWQEALIASWNQVWMSFLEILPTVLGAVIVFAIGLIFAFWAKRLVIGVLSALRAEKVADSLGIDQFLKKAEVKLNFVELLGLFLEWLIILIFFLAAVDILGLSVVSDVLNRVVSYIPNILAAVLIFAAGHYIARVTENLVKGALISVDHEAAKPVAKFARWLVLVIAFFAGIDQLQIAKSLITTFFQGLTYTIVIVIGLGLGLGSKDLVAKILTDWYKKISK